MNIKELGNYELVNENSDSPILIGTPTFYNFSIQTKSAFDPSLTIPMFTPGIQLEMKGDLLLLIADAADEAGQFGDGCGAWWYITDIKSEYINKIGVAGYFMVLSATVISVYDNNIPAHSPLDV
jgi:hypothetical protein